MTTSTLPARPKPPGKPASFRRHGTPAAYFCDGCRCSVCVKGNTSRQKRRQLFGTVLTDTEAVIPQLQQFLDAGASMHAIAEAAGCGYTTIRLILNGTRKTVRQPTRDKILRLSKAPLMGFVPAIGATRQIRALMAAGHPFNAIVAASDLNRAVVSELLNGHRDLVRGTTAAAVQNAYTQLSGRAGTSVRSASRAARERWAPPSAWDGIDMSDADAFPNWTGACGTVKGFRRHQEQDIPACPPCETAEAAYQARKARYAA